MRLVSVSTLCSPHCSGLWSQSGSWNEHLCETKEAGWGWWEGQWGKATGDRNWDMKGGGGHYSVRCLSGTPYGLSFWCTCVSFCVCVSVHPSVPFTKSQISDTQEGGIHINKPLIFQPKPRAPCVDVLLSLFLWVAGLSAAVLPYRVCIRASPDVCISRVCHCSWLTSLRTPTSIWLQKQRHIDWLTDKQRRKQADSQRHR